MILLIKDYNIKSGFNNSDVTVLPS